MENRTPWRPVFFQHCLWLDDHTNLAELHGTEREKAATQQLLTVEREDFRYVAGSVNQ
jgi:hypothetical protein